MVQIIYSTGQQGEGEVADIILLGALQAARPLSEPRPEKGKTTGGDGLPGDAFEVLPY